jgi:hypothetical protein
MMGANEQVIFPPPPRHHCPRCQICHRTVAYRPGSLSEALTEHYRRTYPKRSPFLPVSLRGAPRES